MKRKKEDIIQFISLKLWLRISSIGFSCLVIFINVAGIKTGEYSLFILLLAILFLLAGFYENSWQFNLTEKTVTHKKGFVFLYKKTRINFSVINDISIETFKRPAHFSSFTEIRMKLIDGQEFVIDRDKTKLLEENALRLSELQDAIKREKEKKAQEFFNAVASDILS